MSRPSSCARRLIQQAPTSGPGPDLTLWPYLETTINRAKADVVVVGTPADLRQLLALNKPTVRVSYKVEDRAEPTLREILTRWVEDWRR